MNIKINKDFEEYKDDFARGFTLSEVVSIAVSLVLSGILVYCLWAFGGIKPDIAVYIAVPFGIPILMLGFYKYQGMSVVALIKEMRYTKKTSVLAFAAQEYTEENKKWFHLTSIRQKKKRKERKK